MNVNDALPAGSWKFSVMATMCALPERSKTVSCTNYTFWLIVTMTLASTVALIFVVICRYFSE